MCNKCNKDHSKDNTGPLTVCETKAYFVMGSKTQHKNTGYKFAYGTGVRFQMSFLKHD